MSDTIVIYYSLEGNVDFVAKKIAENLGADTYRIETLKEYPKKGVLKFFHGGKDVVSGVKPELKGELPSLEGYDKIIIGTPVWAAKPAAPLNTFFDKVNLSGKKCCTFASSAGGNSKKCLDIMASEIAKKGGTVEACAEFANPLKKTDAALVTIAEFADKIGQ